MNDITILHLSDLHIDSSGKKYSNLLAKLLEDIKEQLEELAVEKLVLVVTGDIINAGEKTAVSNAKRFFDKLKGIVEEKLIACYIVPGNHDKKRTNLNQLLIPAYRSFYENRMSYNSDLTGYKGVNFSDPWMSSELTTDEGILWSIQDKTYVESGYYDLIDYIYGTLFIRLSENNKEVARKTFGVDVIESNNTRYCFMSLNTAWSCIDDKDSRHIILGDFQIKRLAAQFNDLTVDNPVDIVIALGHHPLDCLFGTEQDLLFDKLTFYEDMRTNAYLCGHTHDRSIINWSDTSHTMHTLTTGIGWPDKSKSDNQTHYYSIYTFNTDINSIDIIVRSTRTQEQRFRPDLSLYAGNTNMSEKITRPIFFNDIPGVINLTATDEKHKKSLFVTNTFLEETPRFFEAIRRIDVAAKMIIDDNFQELYECWKRPGIPDECKLSSEDLDVMLKEFFQNIMCGEEDSLMPHEVKNILNQSDNQALIYRNFESFVQSLCQIMQEELSSSSNGIIRFHFRYLSDKSSYLYPELCVSFSNSKGDTGDYHVSEMKYGDLLEASFNNKDRKCMIYSVNKHLCKKQLSDRWVNFITIIPVFSENLYKKRTNRTCVKSFPMLTFGATISDKRDEQLLYFMDYFHMDNILGDILGKYVKVFNIDLSEYFVFVKQGIKEINNVNN